MKQRKQVGRYCQNKMWRSLEIFGAWLSWCALNHNYTLPGSHQLVIDWLTPASSQYLVLMLCKGQKVQPFLPLPRWFLPFQMAPVVTLKSQWVTRWHDSRAERFHPLILPSRFFLKVCTGHMTDIWVITWIRKKNNKNKNCFGTGRCAL